MVKLLGLERRDDEPSWMAISFASGRYRDEPQLYAQIETFRTRNSTTCISCLRCSLLGRSKCERPERQASTAVCPAAPRERHGRARSPCGISCSRLTPRASRSWPATFDGERSRIRARASLHFVLAAAATDQAGRHRASFPSRRGTAPSLWATGCPFSSRSAPHPYRPLPGFAFGVKYSEILSHPCQNRRPVCCSQQGSSASPSAEAPGTLT